MEKICKTIRQHSSKPLPREDMDRLLEIAGDYRKVKNYVYARYGGIRSLPKLYPGYTVQNEMTESGLRAQLSLPSVYFYLAIFEALGEIKAQWSRVKSAVIKAADKNERLTHGDRHYLRFVIKVSGCFDNILNKREITVPEYMEEKYNGAAAGVDTENLNRYLCRKVRKLLKKLNTDRADGFAVSERAYRYGRSGEHHGIFISTKESRKRVFVPLTDDNSYKSQLRVRLDADTNSVEIFIPKEKAALHHDDYINETGLSMGMRQMFTTDEGNVYGENLGMMQREIEEFMSDSYKAHQKEKQNNSGRKKYYGRKTKLESGLHDYINHEINRMLKTEKPQAIYMPKLPGQPAPGLNKKINRSVTLWHRGYIRKRLEFKCRENGIEIVNVMGKGISMECSVCGAKGIYEKDMFQCLECGYQAGRKTNAAKNALKRGMAGFQ